MTVSLTKPIFVMIVCHTLVVGHVRFQRKTSHLEHQQEAHHHQEPHGGNINNNHISDDNISTSVPLSSQIGCSGCPGNASCVLPVQCPAWVRYPNPTRCHLTRGKEGVCCTTGQEHSAPDYSSTRSSTAFDVKSVWDARVQAKMRLARLDDEERDIINNIHHNTIVSRLSPSFGHFQSRRVLDHPETFNIGRGALQNVFTMQVLKERGKIADNDILLGRHAVKMNDEISCPISPACGNMMKKNRNVDGSCNNIIHRTWGMARTPFEKLLPPQYDDGVWSPRGSSSFLNSPRDVSKSLIPDKDKPHADANILTMQFGQFIAHDISHGVTLTFPNGSAISCCTEDGSSALHPKLSHFACFPIHISENDKFFEKYNQRCMNFVRTQLAPNHDCKIGYARQMNGATHFLDLSQMYGSQENTLSSLREHSGGRLKMFNDFGRDLLPLSDDKDNCITMEQDAACFKSGDNHVNMLLSLMVLHTVFNREHNRIAKELSILNPHWSDILLFEESRNILIAEFQHIVYNEWLPLVIGEHAMEEFNLRPQVQGYSVDYNPHIIPSITSEFGVAAFRFGHSTVDGKLQIPKHSKIDEVIAISETMFHSSRMRMREYYDRILLGLTSQPMQETDASLSIQLTHYLFRGVNPHGLDLASINIQRGRDHGIRCYNDYRELVGLKRIESFEEFGNIIAERVSSVYSSPDDIDLWIGGLLESVEPDALVGFTFKEIISDQFSKLRKGDRYFYEHSPNNNPGHFSPAQLQEIRKTSMARLICDNSDHIELHEMSPNAFLNPDVDGNKPVSCHGSSIPSLDFTPWKEF